MVRRSVIAFKQWEALKQIYAHAGLGPALTSRLQHVYVNLRVFLGLNLIEGDLFDGSRPQHPNLAFQAAFT
eukprot:1160321-Pelagomonas_calceolata.AAC.11